MRLSLAPFALVAQQNAPFGTDQLQGQVSIVNFMFTECTATCPRQTARLAELQKFASRWPDWNQLRFVSITVDPSRDTPAVLRAYADRHQSDPEHWKFLTGEADAIVQIAKVGFKLPVSSRGAGQTAPLTHSSRFILVDRELNIRGYYDSEADDECRQLVADLRAVLSESSIGQSEPAHVPVPADLFYTPWLDEREAAQLATADSIHAFHDFRFTDALEESGIGFINRVVADAARNFKFNHYDHGNGIAAADVDRDGLVDLYFVNQVGGNALWRNVGGGRFENVTEDAGVALKGRVCVAASFADTDNDGDLDLFVTTTRHGNALFENDGAGRYRDVTASSGLTYRGHSSGADFFDYDRDGLLDLFVSNVGIFTTDTVGQSRGLDGKSHSYFIGSTEAFGAHLISSRSERSILYHNDGENQFHDASEEAGLAHTGWAGDATPLDGNADGWTDLYVVNMQGNDEYYENREGTFVRRGNETFEESVWGGMGVKSVDYNNDGGMDLFVTNMHADMWDIWPSGPNEKRKGRYNAMPESFLQSRSPGHNIFGNAAYENHGGGHYQDVSDRINSESYWPWGLSAGDLNADGFQDLFITSSMNLNYRYHPNSLLLNEQGRRFADAEFVLGVEPRRDRQTAARWFELDCSGADADHALCAGREGRVVVWGAIGSRSSVIFDLDNDGDLDIVTNDFNSAPLVLVSNLSESNARLRYIAIRLVGSRSNRDGLGTRVEITAGGRTQTQLHDGQSGYLSQSALPLYFGLGEADSIDQITIQWPGGARDVHQGPFPTNRQMTLKEPAPTK
ncbi:MAG: FG-GAP-like repeat-containing protein [Planctomycetales bacterium]